MSNTNQTADLRRLLELESERAALTANQRETGPKPLWIKLGDFLVSHSRQPKTVSRRKYLGLALSCGWLCGAHRWYAGEKGWAILYLLTWWTGFAAAMTIVDLVLLWLKYQPDENGMITI